MKLMPLFDLEFTYTTFDFVGPMEGDKGKEDQGWGLAEGSVRGERVSGNHHSCNHPRQRADNVNLPDAHGIITTDDGAKIYYHLEGFGIATQGTRRTTGSARFRTGDPRYSWLNTVIAVDEGRFSGNTALIRFYECVADEA